MQLNTSYRQILSISIPIMLGSAAQNVIALSDSVFLYHLSETDFAAIGFVSVFYLIIAAIGFGFSKGAQILIARRYGERNYHRIGVIFYKNLYFQLGLASLMFVFMFWGTPWFFQLVYRFPGYLRTQPGVHPSPVIWGLLQLHGSGDHCTVHGDCKDQIHIVGHLDPRQRQHLPQLQSDFR